MNFKHSGCLGDLIYSLPIIKHYSSGNLYLNLNSVEGIKDYELMSKNGLTEESANLLKPLLLHQDYISQVQFYKNEIIDRDLDNWRTSAIGYYENNTQLFLSLFNLSFSHEDTWLKCPAKKIAKYVINRTSRYQNPEVISDLRKYLKESIFVGFKHEWLAFCRNVGQIEFYGDVKDFLELASIIQGCEVFIGNQSFCMAIAIGLGKNIIQEVCPTSPNCIFKRKGSIYLGVFDEEEYFQRYADVKNAVMANQFAFGVVHYNNYGREEGRIGCFKNIEY